MSRQRLSATKTTPPGEHELGVYVPKYPDGRRAARHDGSAAGSHEPIEVSPSQALRSVIPWELRQLDRFQSCPAFRFLATARFWRNVEGAFRTAVVGMLPPAVVLYSTYDNNNGPWKSQSIMIVGAMLGVLGKETIGLQVQYMGTFLRASAIFVTILTVATAVQLFEHMVAVFLVYGACLFLIGTFTEGFTRRVAMLFLTMLIMDMLRSHPPVAKTRRYFDLWLEILIGTGFAFFSTIVPWPAMSSHKADEALDTAASNISIALHGLTGSFWTDTNLTRNVQMVRVRFVLHSIESSIGDVKKHLVGAEHEWMLQGAERRSLRLMKTTLYVKLYRNLCSIRRVVDIVRERPAILSNSERAVLFGQRLGKRITAICAAVDELLYHLNQTKSNDQLLQTGVYFDNLTKLHSELQADFHEARREFFYESRMENLEEFVPLMTFYVFCVSQICITLARLRETTRSEMRLEVEAGHSNVRRYLIYALEYFTSPFKASYVHFKDIVFRRNANDIRYVIEAVKVSAAMVASLVFYYYTDNANAFLSGPTITAFIAGQNPAEAVVLSVPRVSGTLMGIVIGFFIANNAETAVARIAGLITFLFIARMSADVKYIGGAMTFAGFISISQLSVVPLTQTATMSRIQQTTFAVFIYVLITLLFFPCRPTILLREVHSAAVLRIARVYQAIMQTFIETGEVYALSSTDNVEGVFNASMSTSQYAAGEAFAAAGGSFAVNVLEYPKEKFEGIDKQLKDIDKLLLEAQSLIPYAVDEPRLSTVPFPLRATDDAQGALKKGVALLRTMSESMRLLRARRTPASPEMISLLRDVVPCARDTTVEMEHLTLLISTVIMERRADLGGELSKSSHALSHLSSTLHRRKSACFIQVIRAAVDRATTTVPGKGPSKRPSSLKRRSELSSPPVLYGEFDSAAETKAGLTSPPSAVTSAGEHPAAATQPDFQRDSDDRSDDDVDDTTRYHHHSSDHMADDAPDDTIVDPEHHNAPHPVGRQHSILDSKVELPKSFEIPITSQDAESLHTLTFSAVLLAAELRDLLMAVEDSLQYSNM